MAIFEDSLKQVPYNARTHVGTGRVYAFQEFERARMPRSGIPLFLIGSSFRSFLFFTIFALSVRIAVYLFIPIDWNWDSYHHWQIAYYTLHMGLKQGRMWDLRGMEYVWGIVPHLIEAFLLWIFRTSSITPFRILNMLFGSFSAFLVYTIGQEKFEWKVGLFSGTIVAVCSAFVVFDITGLGDTVATFCVISSIFFSRRRPFLSGVLFGLGCQSRIEFWGIASFYFLFMYLFIKSKEKIKKTDYFYSKLRGWLFIMIPFSIFFYFRTGNPIYPFYWSVYNVFGGWKGTLKTRYSFLDVLFAKMMYVFSPSSEYFCFKIILLIMLFICIITFIKTLRNKEKPRNIDFYITLLSIFIFRSIHLIVSPIYLVIPWQRLLMIRVFQVDIALGAIFIFFTLIKIFRYKHIISLCIFLIILPLSFYNIGEYYRFQEDQKYTLKAADALITIYDGGTITCDFPTMVYGLIYKGNIKYSNILSNHYSAFYYYNKPTINQYLEWFINNNITYIVYTGGGLSHQVYSYAQINIPDLFFQVGEYKSLMFMKVNKTALINTVS